MMEIEGFELSQGHYVTGLEITVQNLSYSPGKMPFVSFEVPRIRQLRVCSIGRGNPC